MTNREFREKMLLMANLAIERLIELRGLVERNERQTTNNQRTIMQALDDLKAAIADSGEAVTELLKAIDDKMTSVVATAKNMGANFVSVDDVEAAASDIRGITARIRSEGSGLVAVAAQTDAPPATPAPAAP